MLFQLTIEDESGRQIHELEFEQGPITLGRGQDCTVQLRSGQVSRTHARLGVSGTSCIIEDLNSANGVLVDGRRIQGVEILPPQAEIRIGEYTLRIEAVHGGLAPMVNPVGPGVPVPTPRRTSVLKLIRYGDHLEGETHPLIAEETSIGRVAKNDLQLVDGSISRYHARIVRQQGQFVIVDLGSANGTFVNGVSATNPILLSEGDHIQIGNLKFLFADSTEALATRTPAPAIHSESGSNVVLIAGMTLLVIVFVAVAALLATQAFSGSEDVEVEAPEPSSEAPETATDQDPTLSAAEHLANARAHVEAHEYEDAIADFNLAIATDPQLTEARLELQAAEREAPAWSAWQTCQGQIDTASGLEAAGQALSATESYEQARECMLGIAEGSLAHTEANAYLTSTLDPTLISLYRYLGTAALEGREFDSAVNHLLRAEELYGPDNVPPELRTQLRVALLGSGDAAYEREAWDVVVRMYEAAAEIEELDRGRDRRLDEARDEMDD